MTNVADFDATKYFLGHLCKHSHKWNQTIQTLRLLKNKRCVICQTERDRAYRERNKEKATIYRKNYFQANKEEIYKQRAEYRKKHKAELASYYSEYYSNNRERVKLHKQKYRQNNKQKTAERSKQFYQENRDKLLKEYRKRYHENKVQEHERSRRYRLLNPEIGKRGRQRYRARKLKVHAVSYTNKQLIARFSEFDNCCAYCGKNDKLTIDHFIPISKQGPDCLGNIVPACGECNSSKRDREVEVWYPQQLFYSKRRWQRILAVLGKKENNLAQLPLF